MASEVTWSHKSRKYKAGDGYVDELVKMSHSKLNFDLSPIKSQAIVVAGESGSGKTTFSRYGVRRLLQNEQHERDRTGFIYLTIPPTSRHKNMELEEQRGEYSDAGVLLRMLFAHCLRVFDDKSKREMLMRLPTIRLTTLCQHCPRCSTRSATKLHAMCTTPQ